jgi:hypothetical protein
MIFRYGIVNDVFIKNMKEGYNGCKNSKLVGVITKSNIVNMLAS